MQVFVSTHLGINRHKNVMCSVRFQSKSLYLVIWSSCCGLMRLFPGKRIKHSTLLLPLRALMAALPDYLGRFHGISRNLFIKKKVQMAHSFFLFNQTTNLYLQKLQPLWSWFSDFFVKNIPSFSQEIASTNPLIDETHTQYRRANITS
jgi:hypothetical protein